MGISVAKTTDAEAIAGLDDSKFLSPAKLRKALNANGSSPIFACRAWVNFNGTGIVAINSSGNVSSITDNGVGDYTLNFTNAMQDANYSWAASGCDSANSFAINETPTFKTNTTVQLASSLRIQTFFNSRPTGSTYGNGVADLALINMAIFR